MGSDRILQRLSEVLHWQSSGTQMLAPIRPRFGGILNRSWVKTSSLRAFSSSSSASANQSRGGLPRFFSKVLPTTKVPTLSSLRVYVFICCQIKWLKLERRNILVEMKCRLYV